MAAKAFFVFCASSLLLQTISGQCIGAVNNIAGTALAVEELGLTGNALAYGSGLGIGAGPYAYAGGPNLANYGLAANSFIPSNGGGFAVTSVSPIAPTGITVISENAIEGSLAINGELPFLGAVALDGALPTAGAGGINYGCGNGAVGIVSEGIAPAVGSAYGPMAPAAGIAPGRFGYGPGLAGPVAGFGAPGLGFNGLPGGCGAFGGVY